MGWTSFALLLGSILAFSTSPSCGLSVCRRNVLRVVVMSATVAEVCTETVSTSSFFANAACLPGDLAPDCIGVYKVPIDDNIKSMVGTKEALEKYAPSVRFVPPIQSPKNTKAAFESIKAQRLAADDIQSVVASGRLEEAGIKVLNLIPKLSAAGQILLDNSKREGSAVVQDLLEQQATSAFLEAEVAWKNTDVTIGQGLRGDLGVSAVAQLTILSDLREATVALDNFIYIVERQLKF